MPDHKRLLKYLKTLAIAAGVFLLLAIVIFFAFRNLILHKALDRVAGKLHDRFQVTLHVDDARFTGITSVSLKGITLVPLDRDTLLRLDTLETGIRFWYALIGDIRIQSVDVHHGYLQLTKKDGVKNFSGFIREKKDSAQLSEPGEAAAEKKTDRIDFARTAFKLIDGLLDHIPAEMRITAVDLRITDEKLKARFSLESLIQSDDRIEALIHATDLERISQHWKISGLADPSKKQADIHFYNMDTGLVVIPYISQKFNLATGFDTIHLELDEVDLRDHQLHITGKAGIDDFLVNHPKISKKDVVVDHADVAYHFIIGEHFLSLDSSTRATFNQVTFHPFVKLDMETDTIFSLSVQIPRMPANHFIQSLPEGLFTHFKGMEVTGEFDYRLDFIYNENHPQDLVFESLLNKYALHINRYGEANLAKLNGDFVYVPMEKGRPQRPVMVGLSNPDYTPIDQISPYLQKCVLTTEDPSFFWHRGFIDEAFRQSIIKNIRKRKFARGASTISMQLVKNVFLTREKTLSRKMEEILLVYILENNHISTKQRMLEVYFNIIEWGPDVYGIGEASRFYFNKKPAALTLKECLFLATIIPRPKGFMWRFDKEGHLKPFAEKQFTFLTNLMLRRNVLISDDTLTGINPLSVTGNAKSFIKISADTLVQDTILLNENGILQTIDE